MNIFRAGLGICLVIGCVSYAQPPGNVTGSHPELTAEARGSNLAQASYYATLNRGVLESNAQLEFLRLLVQEHKKRAEEAPRDQPAKAQWESELVKELGEGESTILKSVDDLSRQRVEFERAYPTLAGSLATNYVEGATNGPSPAEISFLAKLEERRAAVQQEWSTMVDAGTLYSAQLRTNTGSYEFSRLSSLIQDNGNTVRLLQKELSDLELRGLEFRALRKH